MPCTDEDKVGVIYYYELRFPEAFQQHKHYAMKTIGKQVFSRSGLQRGFLLEMDKEADLKQNVAEIRKVYFRHHAEISKEIFASSQEGKEFFRDDILMHAWHDRLKQRFNDKVVSRKAVRLNVERNPGETEESITKKLAEKGITVDDFAPSFTEEELNQFYGNIESWWVVFHSVCLKRVFRSFSFANISLYLIHYQQACLPIIIFIRPETDSCQDQFLEPVSGKTSCPWQSFP